MLTWSYEKQDWVFDGCPMDDDFCEDCQGETRLEQKFDEEEPKEPSRELSMMELYDLGFDF